MRVFAYILTLCVLLFSTVSLSKEQKPNYTETVQQFVEAFNAHDSEQMAGYVTADVQWLSVQGDKIAIETTSKTSLIKAMDGYFQSCVSCQSELIDIIVSGSRVSTIEEASWQQRGERKAQRSLAVYEFAGKLIRRVYYFPAEVKY